MKQINNKYFYIITYIFFSSNFTFFSNKEKLYFIKDIKEKLKQSQGLTKGEIEFYSHYFKLNHNKSYLGKPLFFYIIISFFLNYVFEKEYSISEITEKIGNQKKITKGEMEFYLNNNIITKNAVQLIYYSYLIVSSLGPFFLYVTKNFLLSHFFNSKNTNSNEKKCNKILLIKTLNNILITPTSKEDEDNIKKYFLI